MSRAPLMGAPVRCRGVVFSMLQLGGLGVVFVMVFGGFTLAGGSFDVILKALPFELMMIGGAAVGAFLIANGMDVVKAGVAGFGKAVAGPKWKGQDYVDVLCLLFLLTKTMKSKGVIALESHIENPSDSAIFSRYPKICKDHHVLHFITDTLRMMTMNFEDPHQVEDMMEKQLEKHHHETEAAADSMQNVADGLPALGIVAAVLGIIKTMSAINEPPAVLGKMIGGALVGTFLGVFLAYGIVGPWAARLKQIIAEESQFMFIIRDVLVSHLHGNAPQVSVEIGRGNVPTSLQPSFAKLEEAIQEIPPEVG